MRLSALATVIHLVGELAELRIQGFQTVGGLPAHPQHLKQPQAMQGRRLLQAFVQADHGREVDPTSSRCGCRAGRPPPAAGVSTPTAPHQNVPTALGEKKKIACPSQRNDYCQLALARWGSARTALSETRIVGQNKRGGPV